jgi:hypothetical protein
VLDCHETQLRHAFHLECLGQMLQRPYAHSCGSCFAAVSPDDAAAIREAFAAQKRARHLQIIRLRQKFAALYEPVVVALESSSVFSASPPSATQPTLSPVVPHEVEVKFDDIVCPCGATRGLLDSTWNWCPQCAVYVGAGLVASCKCDDAEYGDDQDQNWLICDKCGQYSHLECYPEVAEAPDDAPFLCQRCFCSVPAPAAPAAPRAFLHMPKHTQRCALQRAYALAFARADLLGPKREDVDEIKQQKPKKPAPAKKRVLDENGQPRKRGRPRKNASASTTTSTSASASAPTAPIETLVQPAPVPEPEAPQMPAPIAVAEPEVLATVVVFVPPPPVEDNKKAAKPFACPHCPFKSDRVGKLKSHLTVHAHQHRVKVEPEASAVDDQNGNVDVHLGESGAPLRSKSKRALRRQLSAQFVSEDDMTCLL